ncbi:hypothetical protein [Planctobacterium marinum]|uniref:hypothetical protein n=1 Tax=Planctobacterium marinum TaxID=1631968 RepID=UPI001E4F17A3|nr:hypothetical protein [Planctobacterium marinum]MCC2607721.1 hypothetical protein [Planctobacterium marinum]
MNAQQIVEITPKQQNQEFDTEYEKRQTFRGGMFRKDPNAWIYTSDFSKRFDMPSSWVSAELSEGIEAFAIRYQPFFVELCPPEQECFKPANCYLDIYAKNDAQLPWLDEKQGHLDLDFPESPWFHLNFTANDYESVIATRGFSLRLRGLEGNIYEGRVVEFQRERFQGMDLISSIFPCNVLGKTKSLILGERDESKEIYLSDEFLLRASQKVFSRKKDYPENLEATFRISSSFEELKKIKSSTPLPYEWVYSKGFSQRFSLPEISVSENLEEGIAAIVYRKQSYASERCGFFGEEDSCQFSTSTIKLDVFLESDLELVWAPNVDSKLSDSDPYLSTYYLPEHRNELKVFGHAKKYMKFVQPAGFLGLNSVEKGGYGRFEAINAHRNWQNISYFSFYGRHLTTVNDTKYLDGHLRFFATEEKNTPAFEIVLPAEFLNRVAINNSKQPNENSLIQMVKQKLKLN